MASINDLPTDIINLIINQNYSISIKNLKYFFKHIYFPEFKIKIVFDTKIKYHENKFYYHLGIEIKSSQISIIQEEISNAINSILENKSGKIKLKAFDPSENYLVEPREHKEFYIIIESNFIIFGNIKLPKNSQNIQIIINFLQEFNKIIDFQYNSQETELLKINLYGFKYYAKDNSNNFLDKFVYGIIYYNNQYIIYIHDRKSVLFEYPQLPKIKSIKQYPQIDSPSKIVSIRQTNKSFLGLILDDFYSIEIIDKYYSVKNFYSNNILCAHLIVKIKNNQNEYLYNIFHKKELLSCISYKTKYNDKNNIIKLIDNNISFQYLLFSGDTYFSIELLPNLNFRFGNMIIPNRAKNIFKIFFTELFKLIDYNLEPNYLNYLQFWLQTHYQVAKLSYFPNMIHLNDGFQKLTLDEISEIMSSRLQL